MKKGTKNNTEKITELGRSHMCADLDRSKAVELAITQIERQFGKGSIMKLGSSVRVQYSGGGDLRINPGTGG